MTITIKKLAIIIGIIFVLVFIANYLITQSISNMRRGALDKAKASAMAQSNLEDNNKADKPTTMRPWKKTSPEELAKLKKKYNIRVRARNYGPSTPEQWDEYVSKRIEESRVFEDEAAREVLKSVEVSKEEHEENVRVNKEHEETVKKLLNEDPFNKKYKSQLQNIYKLQAIEKALKNKVVVE